MATQADLQRIAEELRPRDYTVRVDADCPDLGRTLYGQKLILIKHPVSTEETLWTLFHEYGHICMGHDSEEFRMTPRHVREYECEVWALNRFNEFGLPNQAALEEAKSLLTERIIEHIGQMRAPQQWEVAGIDRRAYDFVTTEQRIEIDRHFNQTIRPLYKDSGIEPEKWYQGWHTLTIP